MRASAPSARRIDCFTTQRCKSAETWRKAGKSISKIDQNKSLTQIRSFDDTYPWLEIECSRCKTKRDVNIAALCHPRTTFVHELASRLRCSKCAKAGRRASATRLQLASRARHDPSSTKGSL